MFGIGEIRAVSIGLFCFVFAYILRSESFIMTFSQDGLAKIVLIGSMIGAIIYYFRERNDDESSENPKSKTSTVGCDEAKCDYSGHDSLVLRQRSLSSIKIKLNDCTIDEVQLPEGTLGESPIMVTPISEENESKIEQDLNTSIYTPKKGTKSIETALFVLDPATEWSNESGTPVTFQKYKSSGNLNTLFENPVEEEEREVYSECTSASDDCVKVVDMEIDSPPNRSIDTNNVVNTSKKSMNASVDSHDIVDMDIDEDEFLKTLELTPLKIDFSDMDISKSIDLNSTRKRDMIPNVAMLSDLFQESFKFETSLDSCANVSLNKELSIRDEINAQKHANDVNNASIHTNGDSAIGSEIAEEEHSMTDSITPLNNSNAVYFPFGHPKKESHAIASKPASHSTGSSFTTILNIHPNHQFNFNSSKIPVMKELEYRRTHLRPVQKHE